MLTASLQSTWEQQNRANKPKPRYGNPSYQNFSVEESEQKNNNIMNNDRMLNGKSLFGNSQVLGNNRLPDAHELPNLRVPQVSFMIFSDVEVLICLASKWPWAE